MLMTIDDMVQSSARSFSCMDNSMLLYTVLSVGKAKIGSRALLVKMEAVKIDASF